MYRKLGAFLFLFKQRGCAGLFGWKFGDFFLLFIKQRVAWKLIYFLIYKYVNKIQWIQIWKHQLKISQIRLRYIKNKKFFIISINSVIYWINFNAKCTEPYMCYLMHILYIHTWTDYLVFDFYRWMWSVSYSLISCWYVNQANEWKSIKSLNLQCE